MSGEEREERFVLYYEEAGKSESREAGERGYDGVDCMVDGGVFGKGCAYG